MRPDLADEACLVLGEGDEALVSIRLVLGCPWPLVWRVRKVGV